MQSALSPEVCVFVLACGSYRYHRSALEAVSSLLENTPFDVCLISDRESGAPAGSEDNRRFTRRILSVGGGGNSRAAPFLRKFDALKLGLAATEAPVCMMIDADAIVVRRISGSDVHDALGSNDLAMVEQTTILGSGMTREHFLQHYQRHTLAWFGVPDEAAPEIEQFRFFNTGVVLGRREALSDVADWALGEIRSRGGSHHVGEHMIADQDYVQFWCNQIHPGRCASLPWHWNHCEHWDPGFPRSDALIAHFSNFCRGPSLAQRRRMRILRQQGNLAGLEARFWNWWAHRRRG